MDYSLLKKPNIWIAIIVPLALLGYGLIWFIFQDKIIWQDVVVLFIFYQISLFGVAVGSHRYLSHRSFKASPIMECALFVFASSALQYSPLYWAAKHRKHHRFTDLLGDPHSPKDGWMHAYFLWAFKFPFEQTMKEYAPDLLKKKHFVFLHRIHFITGLTFIILPGLIEWFLLQDSFGLIRGIFWGGLIRILLLHNSIFTLNSFAGHGIGTRIFEIADSSRNNVFIFPLVLGDCWHHNHHDSPASATTQARWYHVDPFYYVLKILEKVGLVSELKPFKTKFSITGHSE